jgi:chromate transporter
MNHPPPVSLAMIYGLFFRIGLFSFGGQLTSWIHREVVLVRGWMTNEEFLSGMALSQILPGVNSTNTAIFVGQRLRGAWGATAAIVAMLTGPFFAVILAAIFYKWIIGWEGMQSVMEGVAAVALGMLARLGISAGRGAAKGLTPALAMLATFVGVGVMRWPMLGVVAVVAPISVIISYMQGRGDEG